MLNQVNLVGRLGRDPEVNYLADGTAAANINIATDRHWKNKAGEKQDETEWHRITAYGRLAEIMGEYLSKGSLVFISGRLKTRKWQDKQGGNRYTTEIIAGELKMLGDKKSSNGKDSSDDRGNRKPPQQAPPADFDDSIPF